MSPAHAQAAAAGDTLVLTLTGRWRITEARPCWKDVLATAAPKTIRFEATELESWDSALVLFINDAVTWADQADAKVDLTELPPVVAELVGQLQADRSAPPPEARCTGLLSSIGLAATGLWQRIRELTYFVGECVLSAMRLLKQPQKFRWADCLHEMQQCGAMALPITGLIAFLIGVTLAYTGAVILRQFGADIWVADLVGLSMTREMGAVMTGIVLAGRTGAAFAAEIGNMKAGEELDALETLGIRPVDFLVIPRIIALLLMMPLLAMYANALGIIGGMVIALGLLDISPTAYWVEMLTIVDLSDLTTGLIKAVTFGAIVALSGCLRGMQAERSAVGVGRAATSAVVTSILLIVVADALFAVIFNILGW
ncbi:MAG TPA: ABC transporter permease [Candidatus Synoicihabitans sp.]|nr:ABC transporter permease [Candidatus Synoicihabitans sp.]